MHFYDVKFLDLQVAQRHAAVLVPLFEDASGTVQVLLTQRAASLRSHAGTLPGATPAAAAPLPPLPATEAVSVARRAYVARTAAMETKAIAPI